MRRPERNIREKMERRRKRKSLLREFWFVCFVVFVTLLLNSYAVFVVRHGFNDLLRPWWETGVTWEEVFAGSIGVSMVIAAFFWDRLLFIGFCRRAILPKIEVSVSPMRVAPGDVVKVSFCVKGTTDWFRRMQAQLESTEVDDDCMMENLYRETIFSSSKQEALGEGSFTVSIPRGFPNSGFNEKKRTAIMWGVSFRGRTAQWFMPDVLGFEEIEVAEESV